MYEYRFGAPASVAVPPFQAGCAVFMDFPKEHRVRIHSTNVLERLNGEIKRRADVVGIFPNENAVRRLVGALLMEQNDEYAIQKR